MERAGFLNAFSTRRGGVSSLPAGALNLHDKNDSRENVQENRRRFRKAIGAGKGMFVFGRQIHGADVARVNGSFSKNRTCDALISDREGVFLTVKTADCLPILLADPRTGAYAAVHAGWRGTVQGVVQKAVLDMERSFGTDAKDIRAALGPAACVDCYEVGEEVVQSFRASFSYSAALFKKSRKEPKPHLNLKEANRRQLLGAGLDPARIYVSPHCTIHQNHLFFSHRRESRSPLGVGRQWAVIGRMPRGIKR